MDDVEKDTPRDPVGQMEYASADDNQTSSDHAPPDEESSEIRISKIENPGPFPQNLYGPYRKEACSRHQGDILTLRPGTWPAYDTIVKRVERFMEALRSKSTEVLGVEVAPGVYVLNHRSNGNQFTADAGFSLQVEFHRIKSGNSLNKALMSHLMHTFRAIGTIERVNAVVLTAAPLASGKRCFSAGADITTMAELQTAEAATSFIKLISKLCTAIRDLPAPVVAAIDGPCIGAGLEVAASCDLRVGTSSATFSMPEVILGIPSVVEARLLCDIVGWGRARHLMFTGCTWSAPEAVQAGLITAQFDKSQDMSNWIASFIENGNSSFQVYRDQKALMRKWEDSSIDEGIAAGVESFANRFRNPVLRRRVIGLIGRRLKKAGSKGFPTQKRLHLGASGRKGTTKSHKNGSQEDKSTSVDPQEDQPQ